ncbi:transport system permease protein [Xylanimonas cellulosilytica DSM 15894]|uniref:Transport system permease protein n=1 Tax=Xylanimonas cellulosilytica (strain DSM 15894 / JCM 12276 / CECT 5975 / KCTC 9989 / LMG 20990 / NBRC 107835 / XIL07) TaxID=446471 RepID=D1BXY3_XYLCX|nr:transport system permease protein [Xylanimonas cellulosilytica DSM 15894]
MTALLAERPAPTALPPVRSGRVTVLFVVLAIALVALTVVGAGSGQLAVAPAEVVGSVLHRLGLDVGPLPSHPNGDAVLWTVRFPRVAMAVLVGAALATAGALMQGVFGNPLAEPGVVGVSSGAAVAASATIVFGLQALGPWTTAVAAFGGGLVATFLVYGLARSNGRTEVVTLVLTGVAINAVCGALIALLTFLADTQAREQIVFWQLGSLNGTRWAHVAVVAPFVAVGLAIAASRAHRLDLLALGERSARHVGVDVERLRLVAILAVALLTAAAVAFCGIIAFVGLVVPHLVRMAVGPAHRVLVPASALGGAVLLLAADLAARTAVAYADLPIGMLTALVGGPFFFWLIRRTRRQAGGWA